MSLVSVLSETQNDTGVAVSGTIGLATLFMNSGVLRMQGLFGNGLAILGGLSLISFGLTELGDKKIAAEHLLTERIKESSESSEDDDEPEIQEISDYMDYNYNFQTGLSMLLLILAILYRIYRKSKK